MQGWSPSIINANGFDIIAVRQGETLRVQSKATKRPYEATQYQWSCSVSRPKRPLTIADCDIVAFVALDSRRVYFVPIDRVNEQLTFKLPIAAMHTKDIEETTLLSSLRSEPE
tara:strand:+ start:108 stop:446 length:339 start_codon:yes stop_codon:yes gene_type:complete